MVSFMLLFPMLKKFSNVASKRDYEYLIVVFLFFEFLIKFINSKYNIGSNIRFDFFKDIYIYPIMGDLICNKYLDKEIKGKNLIIILMLAIAYKVQNEKYNIMNVYVSAFALYLLRYISIKNNDFINLKNKCLGNMILFASSNALFFYLLHPYSLKLLFRVGDKFYKESKGLVDIFVLLIFWFLNFALCYIIIVVYKKIKNIILQYYISEVCKNA